MDGGLWGGVALDMWGGVGKMVGCVARETKGVEYLRVHIRPLVEVRVDSDLQEWAAIWGVLPRLVELPGW